MNDLSDVCTLSVGTSAVLLHTAERAAYVGNSDLYEACWQSLHTAHA